MVNQVPQVNQRIEPDDQLLYAEPLPSIADEVENEAEVDRIFREVMAEKNRFDRNEG